MQNQIKVYTFNADENTRVKLLWALRPHNKDKLFDSFIKDAAFIEVDTIQDCDFAIYPQRAFDPETLSFNSTIWDGVAKAKKYAKPLIIDATSDSDEFLDIPGAIILRCGLYRSLQQPFEIECPFWSNYRTSSNLKSLAILPKGSKPRVGFCGTTTSNGKLASVSKNLTPTNVAASVLSQGIKSRTIDRRIIEGMSLHLREVALNKLVCDTRIDSYFDVTNTYQSYYVNNDANKIALENLFITNTSQCDYVVCVRGSGNYSGRFYMALNAGRIPVVMDTDTVIPYEEKFQIVKVPATSIDKIGEYILQHFVNTSNSEFEAMKRHNRRKYQQLLAPESFFANLFTSKTVANTFAGNNKARSNLTNLIFSQLK